MVELARDGDNRCSKRDPGMEDIRRNIVFVVFAFALCVVPNAGSANETREDEKEKEEDSKMIEMIHLFIQAIDSRLRTGKRRSSSRRASSVFVGHGVGNLGSMDLCRSYDSYCIDFLSIRVEELLRSYA
jgi:hypothetical protein